MIPKRRWKKATSKAASPRIEVKLVKTDFARGSVAEAGKDRRRCCSICSPATALLYWSVKPRYNVYRAVLLKERVLIPFYMGGDSDKVCLAIARGGANCCAHCQFWSNFRPQFHSSSSRTKSRICSCPAFAICRITNGKS